MKLQVSQRAAVAREDRQRLVSSSSAWRRVGLAACGAGGEKRSKAEADETCRERNSEVTLSIHINGIGIRA